MYQKEKTKDELLHHLNHNIERTQTRFRSDSPDKLKRFGRHKYFEFSYRTENYFQRRLIFIGKEQFNKKHIRAKN